MRVVFDDRSDQFERLYAPNLSLLLSEYDSPSIFFANLRTILKIFLYENSPSSNCMALFLMKKISSAGIDFRINNQIKNVIPQIK